MRFDSKYCTAFEFMMIGIVVVSLPILLISKFNVVSEYFKSVAPELLGFKDLLKRQKYHNWKDYL